MTMETQERPNASAIKSLKEKIKGLASGQRTLKTLRKTTISEELRKELLSKAGMTETWKVMDEVPYKAWSTVETRRTEITACLNLYHELRGSEYRHGIEKGSEYFYEKTIANIRKDLAKA
jgi:hypothetical protein